MNFLQIHIVTNERKYDYESYFLEKMAPFVREQLLVFEYQSAHDEYPAALRKLTYQAGPGSVSCYKCALEHCGEEELSQYDRIVFTCSEVMGPLHSPEAFFRKLEQATADVFYLENLERGFVSSYLFCIKPCHARYDMHALLGQNTSLSYASYFEDEARDYYVSNLARNILERNSPFVYKKVLTENPSRMIYRTLGMQPCAVARHLETKTDYPTDMMWSYLLETTPMSVLRNNLHHNYILSSRQRQSTTPSSSSVALICYIYYAELIDYCYQYALSMPAHADIYIITCKESVQKACEERFAHFPCKHLEVRLMENRGRDVAAYVVAARDVFSRYDYVCCMHDKKSPQYAPTESQEFAYHLFECNLASPAYVDNIIHTFDENERLGMLVPPFPHFGKGLRTIGNQMHQDAETVKALLRKLDFRAPFDFDVCAPLGTMFWVRGKAFMPMFRHDWTHESFPPEPNRCEGTFLHGMERFYPFVAQEAGYFVGLACPVEYASVYADNLYWTAKDLLQIYVLENARNHHSMPGVRIHLRDVRRMMKEYARQRVRKIFSRRKRRR